MPMLPPYERVAADLREKIAAGEYPPGTLLPSRAALRHLYAVSDTVLDKAMAMLRREKLTETVAGIGVYVAGPPG